MNQGFELLIGYRSILRMGANDNAIQVAESQLSSWLRSKRRNGIETTDWDGPGEYQLGDSAHLSVVHGGGGLDGSNRRLYRFREENPGGNWIVSVYALDTPNARDSQRQSIVVEVSTEAPDTRSAITKVRTPRLVREILQAHDASDGSAPLTGARYHDGRTQIAERQSLLPRSLIDCHVPRDERDALT